MRPQSPQVGRETEDPVTELTFIFAEGDESGTAAMTDMVARFNDCHDNIVIQIQSGGSGTYDEKLKTLESVGEFPTCWKPLMCPHMSVRVCWQSFQRILQTCLPK